MNHVGDITKLNGAELPIVDIVTGGSPCQDLSVAGKRAGLAGERSGLFMEQIRIIKEMRNESVRQIRLRGSNVDNRLVKPRYMVWENVPGAFSSNHGEDFRAVLEETARVADQTAVIPGPPKNGWSTSGCIMGDGWSIAWRVHDAQFWGVPQRRKRISLVADFGGQSAPEILFERESVSGDFEQSGETGQGTSTDATGSTDPSSYTLKIRGGVEVDSKGKKAGKGALVQTELSGTLGVSQDQTLITKCLGGEPYVTTSDGDVAGTLDASYYKGCGLRQGRERTVVCIEGNGTRDSHKGDGFKESDTMYTLNTVEQHGVCYGLDRASFNQGKNAQYDFSIEEETAQTLVSRGPGGVMQTQ